MFVTGGGGFAMSWFRQIFGGPSEMVTLTAGKDAPDFSLKTVEGKEFSLGEALTQGPVVLAFFKVSCPTCQYAFPFFERLFRSYKNNGVTIVGVSQNDLKDTAAFAKQFGVTFPIALDNTSNYPVSNAYGLTNVPTVFWIAQDGEIEVSSVGWVKSDYEAINRRLAETGKVAPAALFKPGEEVRDYKAG
jgi:peroxiredoxin